MHGVFRALQFFLVAISPLLSILISFLLLRLLKIEKISEVVIQSSALLDGFILCIFLFGLAILASELFACWNTDNPLFRYIVIFKFVFILISLIATGLRFTNRLHICCSEVCCSSSGQNGRGQKCVMFAFVLLMMFIFICSFAVLWAIISSFAALLLSLAYPLYVTTLFVLHFTFIFALSVTIGLFVSETISNWKLNEITKQSNLICCILGTQVGIRLLFILAIGIALYVAIICGYAFTIVQRIVPADGLIHGLLFLPSVIIVLIGWLFRKRFFGML